MNKEQRQRRDSRQRLLDWYDEQKRDLPWRRTEDPYAIWVSEIMLQQTRVETVLPFFERFLSRFPTVETLAQAETEEVLGLWSGLGYYRRARLLHEAAGRVVEGGGQIPTDIEGLRKLPGVGAYTAAAIGSIAFGLAEPTIDGNVERVISRYRGIAGNPKRGQPRQQIARGAINLVDPDRPGDSNQALMELGATMCRPRNPRCSGCPLGSACHAHRLGDPEGFPTARPRAAQTKVVRQVMVVQEEGRTLLFRRPESSEQLSGMWELPWLEPRAQVRSESLLAERYGGDWQLAESLGRVKHSITHRSFDIEAIKALLGAGESVAEGIEAGWFSADELGTLPTSSLVKKVLALVP